MTPWLGRPCIGAPTTFFGCYAYLGYKVPDDFDEPDEEIADLFESQRP